MNASIGSCKMGSDIDKGLALFRVLCPHSELMNCLVVEGEPPSKARPRFSSRGRVYTPKKQVEAERYLSWRLKQAFKEPLEGNIAVGCVFYRSTHQRIDVDNMMKHVLDAANGVCWIDDSQVTAILGTIEFDPDHPRTIIMIGRHDSSMVREGRREALCAYCGKPFDPRLRRGDPRRSKFCSRVCASRSRGEDLRQTVPCAYCGRHFRRRTAGQRLCSEECRRANLRRSREKPPALCSDCGKPLSKRGYKRCRECWLQIHK